MSTLFKGKGTFTYTPTSNDASAYLKINTTASPSGFIQKLVNISLSQNEVSFHVLNSHRVLENQEDLRIKFYTNAKMQHTYVYILQVKLKDKIYFSQRL